MNEPIETPDDFIALQIGRLWLRVLALEWQLGKLTPPLTPPPPNPPGAPS